MELNLVCLIARTLVTILRPLETILPEMTTVLPHAILRATLGTMTTLPVVVIIAGLRLPVTRAITLRYQPLRPAVGITMITGLVPLRLRLLLRLLDTIDRMPETETLATRAPTLRLRLVMLMIATTGVLPLMIDMRTRLLLLVLVLLLVHRLVFGTNLKGLLETMLLRPSIEAVL